MCMLRQKTGHWVKVYQDEYGAALADIHSAAGEALPEQAGLKKFGYKYVYTYGVPSLKIESKGHIQVVHAVNCAEQTRAYLFSQLSMCLSKNLLNTLYGEG